MVWIGKVKRAAAASLGRCANRRRRPDL